MIEKTKNNLTNDSPGESLAFFSLLAFIFLMPLIFSTSTANTWGLWKVMVLRLTVLFLICGFSLHLIIKNNITWTFSSLDYHVLGFLFITSLATYFAVDVRKSIVGDYRQWEGLISVIMYGFIFFFSLNLAKDLMRVKLMMTVWTVAASIVSLYALGQQIGLDPIDWNYTFIEAARSSSTLGSPLTLGAYLALSLPVAVAGIFLLNKLYGKIIAAAIGMVIFFALIFTYTRSAWIAAILALFIFAFVLRKNKRIGSRSLMIISLGLILIVVLIFFLNPLFSDRTSSLLRLEGGARLELWKITAGMIQSRPLFGFGLNTFRLVFPKFRTLEQTRLERDIVEYDYPHNELLQVGVFSGLAGLFAYLVLLAGFVFFSIKLIRESDGDRRVIAAAFFSASIAYLFSVQFSFGTVALTSLFWLMMGLMMSLASSKSTLIDTKLLRSVYVKLLAGGLVLSLCFLFTYVIVRPVLADYYFKEGLVLQSRDMHLEAVEKYEKAVAFNSGESFYLVGLATAYQELAAMGGTDSIRWRALAENTYLLAVNKNPLDTLSRVQLANYYSLNKNREKALEMYESVKKLDPLNREANENLKILDKKDKQRN